MSNLLTAAAPKTASPTPRQGEEFDVLFEQADGTGDGEQDISPDSSFENLQAATEPDEGAELLVVDMAEDTIETPKQVAAAAPTPPASLTSPDTPITLTSDRKGDPESATPKVVWETKNLATKGLQPTRSQNTVVQLAQNIAQNPEPTKSTPLPGASAIPTNKPLTESWASETGTKAHVPQKITSASNPLLMDAPVAPRLGEVTGESDRNGRAPASAVQQNTVPNTVPINSPQQTSKVVDSGKNAVIERVRDSIARPVSDNAALKPASVASETSGLTTAFGTSDIPTQIDDRPSSRSRRSIPSGYAQTIDAAEITGPKVPVQPVDLLKPAQHQTISAANVQPIAEQSLLASEVAPSEHFVTPLSEPSLQTGNLRAAETMLARPEAARMVATQMAEAMIRTQNNKVEIALHPEELGRVRMVLSTTEMGVTVSIVAERAETLDLMRRHIDQLAEEFRELGYQNIGFEFSGGESSHGSQGGSNDSQSELLSNLDDQSDAVGSVQIQTARASQSSGLDLRL